MPAAPVLGDRINLLVHQGFSKSCSQVRELRRLSFTSSPQSGHLLEEVGANEQRNDQKVGRKGGGGGSSPGALLDNQRLNKHGPPVGQEPTARPHLAPREE